MVTVTATGSGRGGRGTATARSESAAGATVTKAHWQGDRIISDGLAPGPALPRHSLTLPEPVTGYARSTLSRPAKRIGRNAATSTTCTRPLRDDRFGSSTTTHPQDPDAPLHVAARTKISAYRAQYANNLLHACHHQHNLAHARRVSASSLSTRPTARPRRTSPPSACQRNNTAVHFAFAARHSTMV